VIVTPLGLAGRRADKARDPAAGPLEEVARLAESWWRWTWQGCAGRRLEWREPSSAIQGWISAQRSVDGSAGLAQEIGQSRRMAVLR